MELDHVAAPPENVWYNSIDLIIPMTPRAHMSEEYEKSNFFLL
jgi:hypothetical protein